MTMKGEQWINSEEIMHLDMGLKNNNGTIRPTCDKMMMKGEQKTNSEDIMPIDMGFKNSNGTKSHYVMKLVMAEKPGTKGEDIMSFNIATKGCNKTNNLCCTELMIKNEPGTKSEDIMPFNNGLKRNNEIRNSCESIDDGAVIKKPGDMVNLNNSGILHSEDNDKKNIIMQNQDIFLSDCIKVTGKDNLVNTNICEEKIDSFTHKSDVLESDSTEIIKEIVVCIATCVDKIDNITENSISGKTNATANKEGSDEDHKIQGSGKSSDVLESDSIEISKEIDVCTAKCVDKIDNITENSNVLESDSIEIIKEIDVFTATSIDEYDNITDNSNTTKTVTVRKRHKVFKRRKNKTVQQHEDGICDKSKSLVNILKRNTTEACKISLVLLYVFCKLFTHKYTGFMMVLTVSSCENIPETSLNLRIDAEEIRHGNTAILKCTSNDLRRLCDITGKSRRWTKGSNHIPLITNGESVNNSKFVEYVNENCTEVELRIKLFNEQDVNVEYNFVYGFEQTTINLTMGNCKYRRYPINRTALLDIQYIHGNLTLRLFLKDIYPIPNCTANLQEKIFPLKKADVNETILSYDVAYIFGTLLEFDECKGEVHIQCSYGTSLEFDKRKTFRCSSGTMTKKNSSFLTAMEIVAVFLACVILVAAIFCWYFLKCKRGGVQGHRQTRRLCCILRLRDENIQTQSDNTQALI